MQNSGLISVNDVVDERFHHIFKHSTFNHMQSAILEQSLKDDCNMVVAAPTGSGKTVIHELAIIKLIAHSSKKPIKVVYVAPNKALCQQKLREWDDKFSRLGQVVMEVTGDIDLKQCMRFVAMANIIITTPEKWDSLTRVWKDHVFLLGAVDLLLIDEVHHLGEDRGATLEALVVRMKMLSSVYIERLNQSNSSTGKPTPMRIIALSATLPNLADIGEWLGCRQDSTHYFDESFRPVPLTVHTLSMGSMNNAFLFDKSLDERVGPLVQRYSEGKQVLIFCASKKSTESLGNLLSQRIPIPPATVALARSQAHLIETAQDPSLKHLLQRGVAYHHSGVCPDDRALVEQLYLLGAVYILCCTSTLAHGVNLPAHLVIIKGTSSWRGGSRGYERTSRADVIQMLGRAGRQGLDDTGVAVIMTSREDQEYYADVSLNAEIVESKLQTHLVEAICAEITQTVITNVTDCLAWMRNTYFYVRVRKNPAKYGFDPISDADQLNTVLSTTCIKAIQDLTHAGLIVYHADSQSITPLPEALIMTRNLIKFPTMQILVQILPQTILPHLLRELSHSPELHKPVRRLEKASLNELMKHTRYPLKLRVQDPWHKVYVLMQAAIGRTEIKDFTLRVEQAEIVECALRVLSALRELGYCREVGALLECTLVLDRSLRTRMWECQYGSIFLQCPALSPTVRNSLTLRNVRTIGDVMGCTLSTVQEMCGGSQVEARAILALAKMLYEGTLEVAASIVSGTLTIRINANTHNSSPHNTVPVDANYPQYTLLAYNVVTSKALCIRNIDRGTRSTQHCAEVGPLLPIEHIKCCLLCTNYVGIDSYQQAAVEVPNTASDSTIVASSTNASRKKTTTVSPSGNYQSTPSPNNTTSHTSTSSKDTSNTATAAKPSPARNLKQTTLRTTSVVDNGPQAGLHGTPYGVRTTTTGYKTSGTSNNQSTGSSNRDGSKEVYREAAIAAQFTESSTNREAIERAQAYMNRSSNATNNSSTSAPSNSGTSTNTKKTVASHVPTSTTNNLVIANSSAASKQQPFRKFSYTDIDDAALGLDDCDANSTAPNNTANIATTQHYSAQSNNYRPSEEIVYEGEDISDYYFPTTNKALLPLNTMQKADTPTYKPNVNLNKYNPAHKSSSARDNYADKANKSISEHNTADGGGNVPYVSNEVTSMRRKAAELDLLSLPVQRINRQRVWGNTSRSGNESAVVFSAPAVATVSPPTYTSPTTALYSPPTQSSNSKKRTFFDQDGPVIPLCEEFEGTANDYQYYDSSYDANHFTSYHANTSNERLSKQQPHRPPHQHQHYGDSGALQHNSPLGYAYGTQYTATAPATAPPTRSYPLAASPVQTNCYGVNSSTGKENYRHTNQSRNLPSPVSTAVPVENVAAQQAVVNSATHRAFQHKVSTLPNHTSSMYENQKMCDTASLNILPHQAKQPQPSAPKSEEFDSIFF